jgi:hypothetical protein
VQKNGNNVAIRSIPEGLLIRKSSMPKAGLGIWTGEDVWLDKDLVFGPYEGVKVYSEREAHDSGYAWQVRVFTMRMNLYKTQNMIPFH